MAAAQGGTRNRRDTVAERALGVPTTQFPLARDVLFEHANHRLYLRPAYRARLAPWVGSTRGTHALCPHGVIRCDWVDEAHHAAVGGVAADGARADISASELFEVQTCKLKSINVIAPWCPRKRCAHSA